jgi:hypothetical protein
MTSGSKSRRASATPWLALTLTAMLVATPCLAGAKAKATGSQRPVKRPTTTQAARGKKPAKGARRPPVRWRPGLELARQIAGKRVAKR